MPSAEIQAGTVMILVVLVALPIGAAAFALGAGNAFSQIGKGDFAMDHELTASGGSSGPDGPASAQEREQEVRQMVEARSYRRQARGEDALDVDAEVKRLLAPERSGRGLGADRELREEVRQLVMARNERRARQGKKELDVGAEVERQLRELENLGQ